MRLYVSAFNPQFIYPDAEHLPSTIFLVEITYLGYNICEQTITGTRRRPEAMPTSRVQKTLARLAKLPRQPDVVLIGGKRQLGIYIRGEDKQSYKPDMVLWLDAGAGFVRASQIVDPHKTSDAGLSEALETLVEALTRPIPVLTPPPFAFPPSLAEGRLTPPPHSLLPVQPKVAPPGPGLPGKIVVNDATLAEAARNMFAPFGVPVEYTEHLPEFDEAFQDLSDFMGADDEAGPPEPFTWEIDEAVLPALYKAAAGFWRRAPWEYMGSDLPVAVELGEHGPQPDVNTLYATILGNGGEVFGIAFYYSLDGFRRTLELGEQQIGPNAAIDSFIEVLRQAGAPIDEIPQSALYQAASQLMEESGLPVPDADQALEAMEDGMMIYFDPDDDSDPTYLDWLDERELKYASRDAIPSFHRLVARSQPRPLNEREARAMVIAIEALNQFFSARGRQIESLTMFIYPPKLARTVTYTAHVGDAKAKEDRITVKLTLPPEGF